MANEPKLKLDIASEKVTVYRDGEPDAVLVQNVPATKRPFLHPVNLPGTSMSVTEDTPGRTPWQHGIFVGLNDVNGVGFWYEGLAADHVDDDGTFATKLAGTPSVDGNVASWAVETTYSDPTGNPMFSDNQSWTLTDLGDRLQLDVSWTLNARVALNFGKYEYGGLFLRMPYREDTGGSATNSEGQANAAAEGQRARWVAIQMPIPGVDGEAEVAMFDHAENFEHPAPWRVDGQLGINPSPSIAGEWTIGETGTRTFQYRLVVFPSPVATSEVEAEWARFSNAQSNPKGEA